ncbi:MAG: Eco57I restriction-modification methylase domain-containing protein [Candidatus Nanohaloarchaea archaeon]
MNEFDLEYLRDKGFFKQDQTENSSISIENKDYSYKIDFEEPRAAYFSDIPQEDIRPIIEEIKKKRIDYIWFWNSESQRLAVYRKHGEKKDFIYNIKYAESRGEYRKSKISKLEKFSKEEPEALFDTKAIVNHFYKNLWNERLKMAKSISNDLSDNQKILLSQKIIDRISFIYFLGKKDIVCAEFKGNRTTINVKDYFQELVEQHQENSYSALVEIFEGLNEEGGTNKNLTEGRGSIYLPHLNGGLFRFRDITDLNGEELSEKDLDIQDYNWSNLIETLNQYEWVIEDVRVEEELEEDRDSFRTLTPEILGHIYEKFVITVERLDDVSIEELDRIRLSVDNSGEIQMRKGNDEIGAYYTPEYITRNISKETMWADLKEKCKLGYDSFNEFASNGSSDEKEKAIEELKNMKILDPAVGSGAFLMSSADILTDWLNSLEENDDEYQARKDIISDNLYGVDLMEGAIQICRLRLWLWLVSSIEPDLEKDNLGVEPLPNIDFNTRSGNSLIGYADIERLNSGINRKLSEFDGESIEELFQKRQNLIHDYRDKHGKEALKLKKKLDKKTDKYNGLLNSKLKEDLNKSGIEYEDEVESPEELPDKPKKVKIDFKSNIPEETEQEIEKRFEDNSGVRINQYRGDLTSITLKEDYFKIKANTPVNEIYSDYEDHINSFDVTAYLSERIISEAGYFHWIMEFSDVFAEGGFDVLVGNPPYGDIMEDVEKNILRQNMDFCCKKDREISYNIFSAFIERSDALLRENGKFGMIIPNSFTRVKEFRKQRKYLLENKELKKIIDEEDPFVGVTLEMVSLFFENSERNSDKVEIESRRNSCTSSQVKKNILSDSRRYVLYSDELWEFLLDNSEFDKLDGTRGPTVKSKYKSSDRSENYSIPTLYSGKSVKEFSLNREKFSWVKEEALESDTLNELYNSEVIVSTRLINQYRVCIKPENYLVADNVIRIENKTDISPKAIASLLNSEFMGYIAEHYLNNEINLTMFINSITYDTPIPEISDNEEEVLRIIHDYLSFLKQKSVTEENKIGYFKKLLNLVTAEIFLKDELEVDLVDEVARLIEEIEFDDWLEEFAEEEYPDSTEDLSENVAEIYQKLNSSDKVGNKIEEIQSHEWVQKTN